MKRTAFLAGSATMVAAAGTAASAQTVPGGTRLVERRADFDAAAFAKAAGRPAQIRQLWEAVAFKPVLLNNIKNAFNGLQFGWGYPADAIAIVLAGHGASAAYGFSDEIWQKYHIGAFQSIVGASGAPLGSNVYLAAHAKFDPSADPDDLGGMYEDTSIAMLQRRGLIVLTCHTAVEEQSRAIVKKGLAPPGMSATDVADDILTHLIPGAIVVPSMVGAVAVLQAEYRYTYATLGG
ncbi:MAG TPA: hypothetical protein VMF61_01425 [Candidatus Acidoferrales bacterium]|nr:hypothetical protein [Candidatus Acidoferrales bacterium]